MTTRSFAAELQVQPGSSCDPQQLLGWTLGWLSASVSFKGGSIARLVGDEIEIVAAFGQIVEAARRVKLRRGEGIA